MSLQTILILVLVGLTAGMLSGLVGIGGGIIIVPSLIYLLGISQKQAQGTSLGILLLPIGIFAVMQYYKQGYINVHYVVLISLSFLVGSYFGSRLATTSISDERLKKIFAIAMMLIAIKMLFFDKHKNENKMDKASITDVHPPSET